MQAIRHSKSGKAPGPEDVYLDILGILYVHSSMVSTKLTRLTYPSD